MAFIQEHFFPQKICILRSPQMRLIKTTSECNVLIKLMTQQKLIEFNYLNAIKCKSFQPFLTFKHFFYLNTNSNHTTYKSPDPWDKLPMGFKSIMRIDRGIEWMYKFASHLKL